MARRSSSSSGMILLTSWEVRKPSKKCRKGILTSHEVNKIIPLLDEDLRAIVDERFVRQHRERALSPARPVLRGSAQNPDVFFQAREAANPFYRACPQIVQGVTDRFAKHAGCGYALFAY